MGDKTNFQFEAEPINYVKLDVILPDGQKEKVTMNFENKIQEEKETILRRNRFPYPDIYVMVLMGSHNSITVLNDKLYVYDYAERLATGSESYLEIRKNSSEIERPPKPVNPALFGINLK